MNANLGLISSAFSASTGLNIQPPSPVIPPHGTADTPQTASVPAARYSIGIDDLFNLSSVTLPYQAGSDSVISVYVYVQHKRNTMVVQVISSFTIEQLRKKVADQLGLRPQELILFYCGEQLQDGVAGSHYGIVAGCTIFVIKCSPGQSVGVFSLDADLLDPSYDADFTNRFDDGQTYWRGGHVYYRPYGWKRYAVKVRGQYEDDVWLGADGDRTESTPGEWPVSYHGTTRGNVKPILEEGYKIGRRALFGPAVYTSPSLQKIDECGYAQTFTYEGKTYKLALQNRVNPNYLEKIPPEMTGLPDFPYWLSRWQDSRSGVHHVRPYGIIVREIS